MSDNAESNVNIRKATKDDMFQICRLIKDLAKFENMEDQVKINPETLIEDGFDCDSPAFSCFVAELPEGTVIGYALYYICYSTWLGKSIFLEDLYVDVSYRQRGIGKKLVMAVADVAYKTSKRLDFHVLSWNPAIKFYKDLGATNLSESEKWQLFRIDEYGLRKLLESE